ncbi:MAG: tRNA dihydrouridine synthase DusB [Candidatus Aeolococcus gillhamiae]|uniref:tRNA-dihydrouridine synthase n=1 Tax=Candidatus Aeolococcus gillhamiae TaxID=3127015 RepID=A0A2W5YXM2_9BACT|nr:MAG: tRNA dihydrouridine synthase DusB [Candidatus Dormibacter sp. RRmetagenome_bin12]
MALAAPVRPALRVGSLELSSPVLIAPMVGITDAPCRELAVELGAGLVCTEMVASEAVVRSQEASLQLLDFPAGVAPAGAQLVGCDPAVMAAAAQVCVERGAVTVDVNLGCPVKKVVGRGSGAALARDVRATAAVLRAMVDAVDVPVTAKMRLGWDAQTINAPELARALADVGVTAITVHGRTRCQGYAGEADWHEIARVKDAVDIPVIGSGDVEDLRLIERRIRSGVVDGVVIARGMLGNFWLVRQASHLLATGELLDDLDFAARIALCRRHLGMLVAYHGPQRALRIGRKYVAWSIKGCNGAARLRAMVQDLDSLDMLDTIFERAVVAGLGPQGWYRPVFTSGEG